MLDFSAMNYVKITAQANIEDPRFKLPYFNGSMYRGALGYALKAVDRSAYESFYEAKNAYHQYRLGIDLDSHSIGFDFYLFDTAVKRTPYVLSSICRLFTKVGLGSYKVTTNDFKLFINDELVCDHKIANDISLSTAYVRSFDENTLKKPSNSLEIFLKTPLRIKHQNQLVKNGLTLEMILNSIHKRKISLSAEQEQNYKLAFQPCYELLSEKLHFEELTRKSQRQKTKMQLGGVMGLMKIKNLDEQSYALLKLGELLAVGKQTVFGLGQIEVKEV